VPKPEPGSRLRRGLLIAGLAWVRVAAVGVTWLGLLAAAAPSSASSLQYYGGPVMHSAKLVLVQWGPHVRGTYTSSTAGDPAFLRYLVSQDGTTSDIGGVLAQYMDTSGANSQNRFGFSGSFQINPAVGANPPANVQDSAIQSELAGDISSGALPAPAGNGMSTIYVILFPPNDDVCFPGNCAYDTAGGFCAYHGSFQLSGSSTQILYAAMPDNGPGTPNSGYCGPSNSDLANQTSVVSHEVAETINDPLVDEAPNWAPPLGWYDPTYDGEVADKCDAEPLAANGQWMIERLWSNLDNNCEAGEPAFSAPTASFLAPSSGPAGQQLSVDASGSSDPARNHISALEQGVGKTFSISSGIASYRWDWGDHTPSTGGTSAIASHTYSAQGTYQVSLTVTDDLGFTSTVTHQVTVTAKSATNPAAVTGTATAVDNQGATLHGTVNPENQALSYQFLYGTDPGSLTQSTPLVPGPGGQTATPVSATLTGLAPSTTYYYELQVSGSGRTFTGSIQSFTTDSTPGAPQTPVAATGSAVKVSPSGALLTGTVNPGGSSAVTYAFSYGTSASQLDQSTPATTEPGRSTAAPVTATLTGLGQATTYYFRLDVSLGGRTYSGAVQTFATLNPPPSVSTGRASRLDGQGVTVSGAVNPNGVPTTYMVEFGSSTAYGYSSKTTSAGSGNAGVPVSVVLGGLRPETTYHYRLVATSAGGTTVGRDRAFTTTRAPGRAPGFLFRAPNRLSVRRLLSHRLRVRFRCTKACTARFVLTVAPAGVSQSRAVPVTLARGTARLHRRGWGTATLWFVHAGRRHARRLRRNKRVKLVLLGYASARGSTASRPELLRIWLSK
jgi:PKD repeat protein